MSPVKKILLPVIAATLLSFISTPTFAATNYVDGVSGQDSNSGTSWAAAKKTIQAGVNVASIGDIVMVAPAYYAVTSPVVIAKGITVLGVQGATTTVVAVTNWLGRTFVVSHSAAILDGFTITAASRWSGGGVSCPSGVVQNCSIVSNAVPYGFFEPGTSIIVGGIYCGPNGLVSNCVIRGNFGNNDDVNGAGGLVCAGGVVVDCRITENDVVPDADGPGGVAFYGGGKVINSVIAANMQGGVGYWFASDGTVLNSVIESNDTFGAAGCDLRECMIRNNNGAGAIGCTVRNSVIEHNQDGVVGGNVTACIIRQNNVGANNSSVENSVITDNDIGVSGGAVTDCVVERNHNGGVTDAANIRRSIIRYNFASVGAGINCAGGIAENCLIYGNVVSGNGGGIHCTGGIVRNCTVVGNSAPTGAGAGVYFTSGQILNTVVYSNPGENFRRIGAGGSVTYSCIQGGATGLGNTGSDPLFVDPSWDYHLRTNSPCINAGSPDITVVDDIEGRRRIHRPDLGAYEGIGEFVTWEYSLPTTPPSIQVLSVSNPEPRNVIQIEYTVTDPDSPIVEVYGYGTDRPDTAASYLDLIYPIKTLTNETATNYGPVILATNSVRQLEWNVGIDIGVPVSGLRVVLLAGDTPGLPVSLSFVTVPADTNGPSFRISQYAGATSDYHLQRALLWSYLKGTARKASESLFAVGGPYDGAEIANTGELTVTGRTWFASQMPGMRLATPEEVARARQATGQSGITKWPSYFVSGMKVNEFGIETTDEDSWYLVRE